jgi:hypothetical protein
MDHDEHIDQRWPCLPADFHFVWLVIGAGLLIFAQIQERAKVNDGPTGRPG